MKKIVVLISGSGSNLQTIMDSCKSKYIPAKVQCVISNNPKAYGIERAKSAGIKTIILDHKKYSSRDLFDADLYDILIQQRADLIVLAGFMRILTSKITENFDGKIINIHPSLLPKYPGLDTHQQVINNKDSIHGVSIHYVSNELDGGPLIAQGEIKTLGDDIENLIERIHKLEHKLYPEIIKLICANRIGINSNRVEFKDLQVKNDYIYKKYDI